MDVVAIGFVLSFVQHTIPKLSAVALHKVKTIVELVKEEYQMVQLKIGKRWRDLRVDGEFIPGQVNSGIRVTSPNLKTKYHLENTGSFEEQNKEDQPL